MKININKIVIVKWKKKFWIFQKLNSVYQIILFYGNYTPLVFLYLITK